MIKSNCSNILIKISISTFLYICLSTCVIAGELPKHYPQSFMWSGTVQSKSLDSILISDREYTITSNNISFHRLNSNSSTLRDLDIGMVVGCEISPETNEIVALWEFPENLKSSVGPWAAALQKLQPQ